MKNTLAALGRALALFAVAGTFTAFPTMAQAPKATVVKNADEKGRAPYMQSLAHACPGGGNIICDVVFPAVPAGKRLVVERVNASIVFAGGGVRIAGLLTPLNTLFYFPLHLTDPRGESDPVFLVNESTLAFFDGGQSPIVHVVLNNRSDTPFINSTLSGYLVDLEQ